MADGQVVFEVTVDDKGVVKSMEKITTTIKQESKKWDEEPKAAFKRVEDSAGSTSKTIGAAFEGAMISLSSKIIDATAQILQAFAEWVIASIDVASNLEEVQNVVDVTFGEEGAKKIDDWAKKAGSQFGLTELQAKKFTATLGAMMKSSGLTGDEIVTMSTELAGLAADFASFYNLDFDTAFNKIRSGISGETEPLKQLGINLSVANLEAFALSEGIETSYKDMTQAEQVLLRYNYLLHASADAQGDFARTASDSYANMGRQIETQTENLQATVGKELLPIAKGIQEDWLGFLKMMNGDNGVAVTGTEDQLTKWLGESKKAAADARQEMDALAETYSGLADVTREDFEPGFYQSYGEFVLATLKARQQFTGGNERVQIDSAITSMDEANKKIIEADKSVEDFSKQLSQVTADVPDTTAAGAEIVDNLVKGMDTEKIQTAVNTINGILSGIGNISIGGFRFGKMFDGSHAEGLDNVPFDGYIAQLHSGEGVLTAEENKVWQDFKNGGQFRAGVDYDAIGGMIRDNMKGGSVYLDGRVVGSVISDMQGRAYRQLTRSGWQA